MRNVNFQLARIGAVSFERTDLTGSSFVEAYLEAVSFKGINLSLINFSHATLNRVNFIGTNLQETKLDQVSFQDVVYGLTTVFPEGFSIPDTGMYLLAPYSSAVGLQSYEDDFSRQDLTGMDFSGSRMSTNFSRAILSKAIFNNATLSFSKFNNANLNSASFCSTNLSAADLSGADLRDSTLSLAVLHSANLSNAQLQGADIRGSDLSQAIVENVDIRGAIYDENTVFPGEFNPEAAGAIFSDEVVLDCPSTEY